MYLAHCMMEWTVLTILSLCLPVLCAVEVTQPYRVVSTDGTAQLQCFIRHQLSYLSFENPDLEVLRVTLLRGLHSSQEVCSSNFTQQREGGVEREGRLQCSAQVRGGAVELTVSGLKAEHTDMYRCKIEVFYPPPYLHLTGNGTLIHVLGSSDCHVQEAHRQTAPQDDEEEDEEDKEEMATFSVPVGALMILIIIVLIIIISFQTLQCQGKKREMVLPGVLHKADAAAFSCNENIA
ncbi:cytotoxic T-lymphocyte protein 4 isoform X1 [Acanthopagrus latus]|uniref:cytotoxic T-lymphocyte protein 4 isoform X1 n=1 Tax=Acanthopagrus latus TaxID=8177 RepID=UPI00187C7982|nr:cytotoxic T-lymphocyte protein 4 isoform X1 [Acanthopagrus latus]